MVGQMCIYVVPTATIILVPVGLVWVRAVQVLWHVTLGDGGFFQVLEVHVYAHAFVRRMSMSNSPFLSTQNTHPHSYTSYPDLLLARGTMVPFTPVMTRLNTFVNSCNA